MKALLVSMTFAAGLLVAAGSYAQAPSTAPAGSTALCKDGTYYSGASKRGACSRHQGVKDWYGDGSAPATAPTKAPPVTSMSATKPAPTATPAAAGTPAPTPAAAPTPPPAAAVPPAAAKTTTPATLPATPAAGGGAGKVWVNTSSKVYHCSDDKYYGKTKEGSYMSEDDAKAAGAHAAHGKACTGK